MGHRLLGFQLRPRSRVGVSARGVWSGLVDPDGPLISTDIGSLPLLVEGPAAEAARPRAGSGALVAAT